MKVVQTFKDFLAGSPGKKIKEKCGPFLRQSGGQPLYRGYGIAPGYRVREVPIRKDRRPRDTSPLVHSLMDDYFDERFGMRVRSQGLFTIGNPSKTDQYGYPYFVFPVGDFRFIWGELEGRPVQDTLMLSNMIKDRTRTAPASEAPAIVKEVLDSVEWRTTGLEDAIRSGAEVVILADSALIVPVKKGMRYEELIK